MIKKSYKLNDGVLSIEYPFTEEHLRTIFIIKSNEGYVSFSNREPTSDEDLDGNDIYWGICDELVEMGFLVEDDESWDVSYELSKECDNIIDKIMNSI